MACHTACVLAAAGNSRQAAAAEARALWQRAPLTKELLKGLTAHPWAHPPPACSEGTQCAAKLAALRVQAAAAVHGLVDADRTLPLAKGAAWACKWLLAALTLAFVYPSAWTPANFSCAEAVGLLLQCVCWRLWPSPGHAPSLPVL